MEVKSHRIQRIPVVVVIFGLRLGDMCMVGLEVLVIKLVSRRTPVSKFVFTRQSGLYMHELWDEDCIHSL